MSRKIDYSVTRIPSNDWDNIMETVTLDGSYPEEIKHGRFFKSLGVVKIRDGQASARIFGAKEAALKYMEDSKKKSRRNEQYFVPKPLIKIGGDFT